MVFQTNSQVLFCRTPNSKTFLRSFVIVAPLSSRQRHSTTYRRPVVVSRSSGYYLACISLLYSATHGISGVVSHMIGIPPFWSLDPRDRRQTRTPAHTNCRACVCGLLPPPPSPADTCPFVGAVIKHHTFRPPHCSTTQPRREP